MSTIAIPANITAWKSNRLIFPLVPSPASMLLRKSPRSNKGMKGNTNSTKHRRSSFRKSVSGMSRAFFLCKKAMSSCPTRGAKSFAQSGTGRGSCGAGGILRFSSDRLSSKEMFWPKTFGSDLAEIPWRNRGGGVPTLLTRCAWFLSAEAVSIIYSLPPSLGDVRLPLLSYCNYCSCCLAFLSESSPRYDTVRYDMCRAWGPQRHKEGNRTNHLHDTA